jgi:hypothetical protein
MEAEQSDLRLSYYEDIRAERGTVDFGDLSVVGDIGTSHVTEITCTVGDPIIGMILTVAPCDPGYHLTTAGKCERCPVNTYSTQGRACLTCPPGGQCTGWINCTLPTCPTPTIPVGVRIPQAKAGYWGYHSPKSHMDACDQGTVQLWESGRCKVGQKWESSIRQCVDAQWEAEKLFRCVEGLSLYNCPMGEDSCLGGAVLANVDNVHEDRSTCASGYQGVLCSVCEDEYYLTANRRCDFCNLGVGDEETSKKVYYALFATGFLLGNLAIFLFLRTGAKQAKKGAVKSTRVTIDQAPLLLVSAEKFKIFLIFFQIFSTFESSQIIEWPTLLRQYMARFSFANLDILNLIALDCVVTLDFYNKFLLKMSMPLMAVSYLLIIAWWKRLGFTRRVNKVRKRCIKCGEIIKAGGVGGRQAVEHPGCASKREYIVEAAMYNLDGACVCVCVWLCCAMLMCCTVLSVPTSYLPSTQLRTLCEQGLAALLLGIACRIHANVQRTAHLLPMSRGGRCLLPYQGLLCQVLH